MNNWGLKAHLSLKEIDELDVNRLRHGALKQLKKLLRVGIHLQGVEEVLRRLTVMGRA